MSETMTASRPAMRLTSEDLPAFGRPTMATVMLVVVVPVLLREVQMLIHRVQQVAGAVSVHRGDRDRVAQSQIIKLIEFRRNLADAVALVDAQHHRLVALLQHGGNLLVGRGDAGLDVYHQDDDLRALDGHLA